MNKLNTSASTAATDGSAASESGQGGNSAPRPSGFAPVGSVKLAPPPVPYRPFDFREAFELTESERDQLQPLDVLQPGPLDVSRASKTALGAVAHLDKYRERIVERFSVELSEIDRIDTYARAATHALVLLSTTTAPPEEIQSVYEAALQARRFLFSDLSNLVTLGLLPPQALSEVSNEVGHLNVATDIQKLVSIAEKGGEAVGARLAIAPEKRNEYLLLAYQLTELASRRDSGGPSSEEARDTLDRAVTLLLNAYDTAERVMAFLLWKDEAYREVVPSLYQRSKSRKANAPPEIPAPVPVAAALSADDVPDEGPVARVAPGVRGGSPFAKDD